VDELLAAVANAAHPVARPINAVHSLLEALKPLQQPWMARWQTILKSLAQDGIVKNERLIIV
jgi:hypothetical protein